MDPSRLTIDGVPNEILLTILSLLPTASLLPLAAVSRRFYSAVARLAHTRMLRVTAQPDYRLILECYHPSAKISTPYLYCDFVRTDSLGLDARSPAPVGGGEDHVDRGLPEPTLGRLYGMYSHFRPVVQEENRRPRLRYPRRGHATPAQLDTSASRSSSSAGEQSQSRDGLKPEPDQEPERPSQDIYLDEDQLFSQLCTVTNLVKLGPKPGFFLSHVNISDGVIRVFRDWLATQAAAARARRVTSGGSDSCIDSPGQERATQEVLWADRRCHVGLKFRVAEKDDVAGHVWRAPVLVDKANEPPVAYRLEFEELRVRTSRLLLMVERSEAQELNTSGKAIVIASI
ncbi:hypothetical protein B0T24DRAFT_589754 [Lasiosphaeria ovina]|uniref:F-box domain-containing protein n=1 Tax=Lasiosphaeria ovina TaxID=92902 RepID=A0AAE0KM27_9PEZI|nr:hypothetical protein B0T24DRAFT_589754 [Lasiosphaeria ovina]